ncbi:MinD/ParA family ATP-binding protein [Paractinoplanes rishiriensis]|uniref:MinD/ParA family ATP-binding protein n=1 Tax=Paractinoplanes rishiriensis TaxID=1050105 RepID=UPI00194306CB|nr:AAA family ATPase [Actinoplanes rishiriensis]
MDGTETGWGRPAEPAPRWRALLDRRRHGSRTVEDPPAEPEREAALPQQPQPYTPLPSRPERRPFNPLEARAAFEERQRQAQQAAPPTQQQPMPPRPLNPLDPRHQSRQQPDTNGQPHSFFSPSARPVPRDYPQVRASAAAPAPPAPPPPIAQPPVAPPPVAPPPMAPPPSLPSLLRPAAAAPTSPAGARIEWRQTRPDDEMERAVAVLRRKLGKPRVLAFANPKGGVHKTTATVLAAATIGSVRGRGVLAWDDNELRGTLGLRAGSARHARTIKHLLADLMQIENLHGDGLHGELDGYLRHAADGSYDVLAGEENPRFAQRLDQATVRRVMDLLRRTHDVVCVDTGNNVESVNWQTVMRQADQLVITTVPREDAAFTADWMLDVLDDSGMGDLVSNAVTLISCPSPGPLPMLADFAKHFATRTRAVAVVPYDPALEVGSSIEYQDLQQETRQAWLRAAAVMVEPFAE